MAGAARSAYQVAVASCKWSRRPVHPRETDNYADRRASRVNDDPHRPPPPFAPRSVVSIPPGPRGTGVSRSLMLRLLETFFRRWWLYVVPVVILGVLGFMS